MGISKAEIAPRFNKKLSNAISRFAEKYNFAEADIRILISPREIEEKTVLHYTVYNHQTKLCDARFDEIVQLDFIEGLAVNEKTVADYIINSLTKFGIGAVCDIIAFDVMIFLKGQAVMLALLKDKKIINYFTVDKLF